MLKLLLAFGALKKVQGYFLEARQCTSDTNNEDDRNEGEGRVEVTTKSDADSRRVPVYATEAVAHETAQTCHYGERAQAFCVVLYAQCEVIFKNYEDACKILALSLNFKIRMEK